MTDNDRAEQIALIQEAVRPMLMELIRAWRTPEKVRNYDMPPEPTAPEPTTANPDASIWGAPNPTVTEPSMKLCPLCGKTPFTESSFGEIKLVGCTDCGIQAHPEKWNCRPLAQHVEEGTQPTAPEPTKDISAVWTRNADGSVSSTFPTWIDECPLVDPDCRCKWKVASGSERTCRYLVSTDQQKHTVRCGYPSVRLDGVTETDIERDGMI